MLTVGLAFTIAALMAGGAFLASYAAENGLPFEMPTLSLGRAAAVPAPAPAVAGPIWCETTRRWRDPVSLRFVKAPR